MNDETKLLHLFKLSHGEMTGACSAEVIDDFDTNKTVVACMKHGSIRWTATREELVFDHITRDMIQTNIDPLPHANMRRNNMEPKDLLHATPFELWKRAECWEKNARDAQEEVAQLTRQFAEVKAELRSRKEDTRDTLMLQMLDLKTAAYNVLMDYVAAIEAMEFEDEAAESTELAEALQKALTQAEEVL